MDNKEIAQGLGINVPFVTMGVFGLGALLAAFGGVIGCAFTAIYPGLDFRGPSPGLRRCDHRRAWAV